MGAEMGHSAVLIPIGRLVLAGELNVPTKLKGVVVIAHGSRRSPRYRRVAAAYSGTVTAVTQHECKICKAMELSVFLKNGNLRLEVRLGPKTFFEEHDFAISRGDSITIVGLRYVERGKEIVLANEIRKGGEHLVLRGKYGRLAWLDVQGHTCPICGN